MIFYGTKATEIGKGKIKNVSCPQCHVNAEMRYTIFSKYVHLYWIPFVPVQRIKILECTSCKSTFNLKDLSENIKGKFKKEQEQNPIKIPILHFTGLFLIAAIALFFYYQNQEDQKNEKIYIKSPKIGDVYRVKGTTGFFSTYKVKSVFKDSLYILVNKMEVDQESGIEKIDIDENYIDEWVFRRDSIESLYKQDEIYQIDRN